jgi:vanillate O-demethylase monooxygenase subunit
MFPKNAWYVACTPHEIDEKPLGRTICGERIAFYRGEANKVAAVEDFCPHRGAPLSLGYVQEGKLVCGYHGLAMGCEGKTVSMPGQRVRGFPAIKSFPVEERYGFIWVWPGDATLANADDIPHMEWYDNPAWAYGGGLFHIQCDYRLMIDNLMDLTHETYVHATSIGNRRNPVQDHGGRQHRDHQPFHERDPAAAVLEDGPACQQPAGRCARGPLADLPFHAA